MKRIYIAGPYSAKTVIERDDNVYRAIWAAKALIDAGHAPYCPHLSDYIERYFPHSYKTWMQVGDAFLRVCDGLLYIGSSPGADRERQRAIDLGIPIYESVKEISL